MSRRSPFPRLERASACAAFFVPFAVALAHAPSSSVWRDDLPMLRGLAWVGNGRFGGISSILVQASFFLPIGSVPFRASACAALVLAACSLAAFRLTASILRQQADSPRLSLSLAAIAGLTATLSATGQREGTVAGGGAVAVFFALTLARDWTRQEPLRPDRALGLGLLFGALAAENGLVALALVVGHAVLLLVRREGPSRAAASWCAGGALASYAFVLAPLYVRPLAPASFLDLGRSAAALAPALPDVVPQVLGGAASVGDEIGKVALFLAFAGVAIGLLRARLRMAVAPLMAVGVVDLLASVREGTFLSVESTAPLHWVVLSLSCVALAVAVQALAVTLLDLRLVMAKQTTILLVMGDLALAASSAEEASFASDRSASRGASAFTDEAIEPLPARALVIVRSGALAHRLWCARVEDGVRPDVLAAPTPILGDTRLALGILRAEPTFQQALRDVSLDARPGEAALTLLADARPTLVELEPAWDRRIVSHLVPDHFWLRFAPEPLGASDRKAASADLLQRFERVLSAGTIDERLDPATAIVLRGRLVDGAAAAAMLGDRDEAFALLEHLGRVSSGDRFVAELTQRLSGPRTGPVDIKGLLR